MKDTLSFVLVLLIATTSLNRGEKIEELKMKELNSKRYPRIMTFPRPGRSSGMTGFARIDRASGLMPFPRVGRSDSTDYDVVLDFNTEDISEVKRQGLIPYPRVGRSHEEIKRRMTDGGQFFSHILPAGQQLHPPRIGRSHEFAQSAYDEDVLGKVGKAKRAGDAVPNGGMWFGPRLGRLHRRDEEQQTDDQQWAVFPLRDYSSAGLQSENLNGRLGRESEQEDIGQSSTLNAAIY